MLSYECSQLVRSQIGGICPSSNIDIVDEKIDFSGFNDLSQNPLQKKDFLEEGELNLTNDFTRIGY